MDLNLYRGGGEGIIRKQMVAMMDDNITIEMLHVVLILLTSSLFFLSHFSFFFYSCQLLQFVNLPHYPVVMHPLPLSPSWVVVDVFRESPS